MCSGEKRRGINLFQNSVLFTVGISRYKSIMLSISHTNTASNRNTKSISFLKNMESTHRELEDTTKINLDFVMQLILSVLLRKLAMVAINFHCRTNFHS